MVDIIGNTNFKNSFPGSSVIGAAETVLLYEGDISRVEGEIHGFKEEYVCQRTARLREGSIVELWDDAKLTYDKLGGIPMVRDLQATGTLYYGVVEYIEYNAIVPATDDAVTDINDQIEQNLLRRARVVFPGLVGTREAIVYCANGGDPVVIGSPGSVKFNRATGHKRFESAASGGAGLVPLHHVAADSTSIVAGRVLLGVGMIPMVVV